MFSKLTALLQQAAEITTQILGPSVSRSEEFQGHWKGITDAIVSNEKEDDLHVERTDIPSRLQKMIFMLREEEEEKKDGMGPCLEFVLQHKLLDTLQTIGQNNYPSGMKLEVFRFFTQLLEKMEQPLIPHISIHQAIQKLIASCGLNVSDPLISVEVQFLRTVCLKFQAKPCLADFFILDNGKHFLVAEALFRIVNSQDHLVTMKAYECLLMCVSLHHSEVAKAMASTFSILLASKLQYHMQLIPTLSLSTLVWTCQAKWGLELLRSDLHTSDSNGTGHIGAFFGWLDYCEHVINVSCMVLASEVCSSISEQLLCAVLRTKLFRLQEGDIIIATTILAKCLQTVQSEQLLKTFVTFVLHGRHSTTEASTGPYIVLERLISHCDHPSDEVCLVTLQLFDVLISLPYPDIVDTLIFEHWKEPTLPSVQDIWTERKNLEMTIESYLALVPSCLTSCGPVYGETDIEQYLFDAHHQVALCRALRAHASATGNSSGSCMSDGGAEVGGLVPALLNKLERLLDQPYDINLVLTSTLAKIAAYVHPSVDHWLISTDYQAPNERNVYSILKRVSSDLQSYAERNPGLPVNLAEARRRLVGIETSDLLSMPHNVLLEGTIVLEEFVKELCALVFAKRTTEMFLLTPSVA